MTAPAQLIRQQVRLTYESHRDFILLLILFVTFRLLALAAYRPGGLVLDFSDFYWYREFAQLTRQGYVPYDNLWTTYPPLFPSLMIPIWRASTLLPPWTFPNLWFTLLLGGVFLLFETGSFSLLYLLARRLYPESTRPIRAAWIYAGLFVPVYTVTGWFESYPLFFFLLSLYLLVRGRPYWSAFFSGVGFMIKLIPVLLLPLGFRQTLKLRYQTGGAAEGEVPFGLPDLRRGVDLRRLRFAAWPPVLYLAVFAATIVLLALPYYRLNPDLILSPFRFTAARLPWETVWALLVGNYDYGIIPQDMRNLNVPPLTRMGSDLPWPWISAVFGLIFLALYTGRIDWQAPRDLVAFAGITVYLFFLISKGYSPQWLGWVLIFIPLLLPNLRGVIYAALLSLANIVEANFFFIMFPEEHWLLAATVLIRTFAILALTAEFVLVLWPRLRTPRLARLQGWSVAALVIAILVGLVPAGARLGRVYFDSRLEQSPYRATISRLQGEAVTGGLLLNSQTTYDWFYPYLRGRYHFYLLDEYGDVEAKTGELLAGIAARHDALWIFDADPAATTPAEAVTTAWLEDYALAHIQDIDGGRLYLFILQPVAVRE